MNPTRHHTHIFVLNIKRKMKPCSIKVLRWWWFVVIRLTRRKMRLQMIDTTKWESIESRSKNFGAIKRHKKQFQSPTLHSWNSSGFLPVSVNSSIPAVISNDRLTHFKLTSSKRFFSFIFLVRMWARLTVSCKLQLTVTQQEATASAEKIARLIEFFHFRWIFNQSHYEPCEFVTINKFIASDMTTDMIWFLSFC